MLAADSRMAPDSLSSQHGEDAASEIMGGWLGGHVAESQGRSKSKLLAFMRISCGGKCS
jgi:hypothetical protein